MYTNYKRGTTKEYQAKKELEHLGYTVTRSSGSHGVFDIWAVNSKELRLIQIKRIAKALTINFTLSLFSKDIDSIRNIPSIPNSTKEIWVWLDHKGFKRYLVTEDSIKEL
jgi:hypothetical protein